MQAIMETIFDVTYLILIMLLGITMVKESKDNKNYLLFGVMAIVLGGGDSFHLVPRIYALWTTGLDNNVAALGMGKFITSITMTLFYLILYHIYLNRYKVKNHKAVTTIFYVLAGIRILLCMMPQNMWTSMDAPTSWAIYRNIPFAIMGVIVIILFLKATNIKNDHEYKYMYLAVVLSFAFYIPVVLFVDIYPTIGMLMIPKTLAYVWIVYMGYRDMKKKY